MTSDLRPLPGPAETSVTRYCRIEYVGTVIEIKSIQSVVGMVPFPTDFAGDEWKDYSVVVEKPGLEVAAMGEAADLILSEEEISD